MTDSLLDLLGLALRGGNLAVGEEPVAEACRLGRARLVLTAADAAENSAGRALRLAGRAGVPCVPLPRSREETGRALGRALCAVAAVTDAGLAAALLKKLCESDGSLSPLAGRLAAEAAEQKKETGRGRKRPAAADRNHRRWPV